MMVVSSSLVIISVSFLLHYLAGTFSFPSFYSSVILFISRRRCRRGCGLLDPLQQPQRRGTELADPDGGHCVEPVVECFVNVVWILNWWWC